MNKSDIRFYVIYSVDAYARQVYGKSLLTCDKEVRIDRKKIGQRSATKRPWLQTESEYDREVHEGDQMGHWKYVAASLTLDELLEWMDRDFCFEEVCRTMGALTIEHGMLPAVSFSAWSDQYQCSHNAYVSLLFPFEEMQEKMQEMGYDEETGRLFFQTKVMPVYDKLFEGMEAVDDIDDLRAVFEEDFEIAIDGQRFLQPLANEVFNPEPCKQ